MTQPNDENERDVAALSAPLHGPEIKSGGGWTWAECLCGWASGYCRNAQTASVAWSRHMAKQGESDV